MQYQKYKTTISKNLSSKTKTLITISLLTLCTHNAIAADKGNFYGDFRLRYEAVEQNNALTDADALTLRSRIGYISPSLKGFSAQIEIEDSRAIIDDYSVPPSNFNSGEFSVIADPESNTEIDQALIKYTSPIATLKLGRQVITLDNHRFVGHVGWRQDRQTFDAFSSDFNIAGSLSLKYIYIDKRNRIFSDDADIDSKDHLFNISYKTKAGKVSAYGYLLEVDNNSENGLDTYGVRFAGKSNQFLYSAEFATQESTSSGNNFNADYISLEGGVSFNGITAKLGYESLGSDEGSFGFSTPLATLHKFNGWADAFLSTPNQGLEDTYALVTGKIAGGKWLVAYHDFSSDVSLSGSNDLGSEINLLYTKKFNKRYTAGIKYADYSAGSSDFSKVDTEKLWIWLSAKI